MKRVLLIKLTSLGDLIHALQALSDAQNARPGIEFDWVIDENFQEVAHWHPAVKSVITTNHREWRGAIASSETHGSISKTIEQIRANDYELVIDGQGNFKTALLSLFSKGPRAGFDSRSVREWVAHLAYQRRFAASKNAHAIERLRRLFAAALDYSVPASPPDFRIQRNRFVKPKVELPGNYLVFVHNASWKTKLWPERHWVDLIGKCAQAGFRMLLPWATARKKRGRSASPSGPRSRYCRGSAFPRSATSSRERRPASAWTRAFPISRRRSTCRLSRSTDRPTRASSAPRA